MRPMIAKMRLKMAMIGPGTSYQPGPAECAERLNKYIYIYIDKYIYIYIYTYPYWKVYMRVCKYEAPTVEYKAAI